MSVKVTYGGPPIVQLSSCLESAIEFESTICSKFYQQIPENKF